uniref:Uncharacterized protein n=1 Tax=Ascaris suum TaxID=6253 RepID=F1KSV7_ASCSU
MNDADGSKSDEERRDEGRPREINVLRFAKERVTQIAELLDAIDNRTLVSGEVTKGPRTALQRLPRHMRRRAMSYNIKRFPRSQRRFAASTVAASKHRKKPPSRLWRRRPRNLLLNYVRRQRKHIWLETHIWHAKRFHMANKWGYRMPLRSFQRAFRPTYRDAMRHCIVRDTSFLRCFQICCDKESELIDALRPLCAPSTSATFAFKPASDGRFEIPVLLYEPGKYPHGFIGPVRFAWTVESGDERALLIWCHPSHSTTVLKQLLETLKLTKEENVDSEESAEVKAPRSVDEWRLRSYRIRTDVYKGPSFKLFDLNDQLIRFRLHGPQSFPILRRVLRTVAKTDCREAWMQNFVRNNWFWNVRLRNVLSGELPDGTVLSLLVEDPRLSRPRRKMRPNEKFAKLNPPLPVDEIMHPRSEFWNLERRQNVLSVKMSESDLQKQRGSSFVPIRTSPAKIPVILIVRNSATGTSNTFTGVDLIAPGGFGMEFWVALQYGTAHAAALRDQKSAEFEANRLNFPADIPDCIAGSDELKDECDELIEKYLSRPHNRRVRYWSSLSVKYPFSFEWDLLAADWFERQSDEDLLSKGRGAFVLRDRHQLVAIEKWIAGKGPQPDEIIRSNRMALVPVRIDALARGRPLRFALICAPLDDDFRAVAALPPDEKSLKIEEPKRCDSDKRRTRSIASNEACERVEEKERAKDMEDDYIELNCAEKEIPISLNELFPDKEILKSRKRIAARRLKRQRSKAAKRRRKAEEASGDGSTQNEDNASTSKLTEIDPSDQIPYRESCSRLIIGRVVRGDYSFCSAKGRALGYCSLAALKVLRKGNVLFRNTTSKYYHPARLSILRTQPDL